MDAATLPVATIIVELRADNRTVLAVGTAHKVLHPCGDQTLLLYFFFEAVYYLCRCLLLLILLDLGPCDGSKSYLGSDSACMVCHWICSLRRYGHRQAPPYRRGVDDVCYQDTLFADVRTLKRLGHPFLSFWYKTDLDLYVGSSSNLGQCTSCNNRLTLSFQKFWYDKLEAMYVDAEAMATVCVCTVYCYCFEPYRCVAGGMMVAVFLIPAWVNNLYQRMIQRDIEDDCHL